MAALSIQKRKMALREKCQKRRAKLSAEQAATSSRAILQRVLGLEEYTHAKLLHTYISSKDNEVDTCELIRLSAAHGKGVVIPVVQKGSRLLCHARITGLEQLELSSWGLYRPPADHQDWIEDLDEIDLIIVPGIAFDAQGRRVGFGGGFYDRFLSRIQALKIGLTYDCLLVNDVPVEPHDVPMDIVVTEAAVYRC